jgi:hypothetical protein
MSIQNTTNLSNNTALTKPALDLINDILNVFILPLVCFLGIILNFFSMLVLRVCQKRDLLFKLMFLHTCICMIVLFISVFTFLFRCGSYCSFGQSFILKIYELYIYQFSINFFTLGLVLIDVTVSFERLFSFSNKNSFLQKISFRKKLLISFFISFLFNIFILLLPREVQLDKNTNGYFIGKNVIGKNPVMLVILNVLIGIRGFGLAIVHLSLNILIVIKFKKHLKQKEKIVKSLKSILISL